MEKIKVTCAACKKETERAPKEPPKTPKEKKQINFICPHCGAKNLRDGTAIYKKESEAGPKEIPGQPQYPERKPTNEEAKGKDKTPEEGSKGSSGFTFFG